MVPPPLTPALTPDIPTPLLTPPHQVPCGVHVIAATGVGRGGALTPLLFLPRCCGLCTGVVPCCVVRDDVAVTGVGRGGGRTLGRLVMSWQFTSRGGLASGHLWSPPLTEPPWMLHTSSAASGDVWNSFTIKLCGGKQQVETEAAPKVIAAPTPGLDGDPLSLPPVQLLHRWRHSSTVPTL